MYVCANIKGNKLEEINLTSHKISFFQALYLQPPESDLKTL